MGYGGVGICIFSAGINCERVLGGEAGQVPELENLGGFRRLELFDEGGFEFRVIEVELALDQIHKADQQNGVALLQAADARDFEDCQSQPEKQLRCHWQGVAEVVTAKDQRIEQTHRVPDSAVAVRDRLMLRRVGEQPGFGNPGALRDAPGEVGREGNDPVFDVTKQAHGTAKPAGELARLGQFVPFAAGETRERLADPLDRMGWWLGVDGPIRTVRSIKIKGY